MTQTSAKLVTVDLPLGYQYFQITTNNSKVSIGVSSVLEPNVICHIITDDGYVHIDNVNSVFYSTEHDLVLAEDFIKEFYTDFASEPINNIFFPSIAEGAISFVDLPNNHFAFIDDTLILHVARKRVVNVFTNTHIVTFIAPTNGIYKLSGNDEQVMTEFEIRMKFGDILYKVSQQNNLSNIVSRKPNPKTKVKTAASKHKRLAHIRDSESILIDITLRYQYLNEYTSAIGNTYNICSATVSARIKEAKRLYKRISRIVDTGLKRFHYSDDITEINGFSVAKIQKEALVQFDAFCNKISMRQKHRQHFNTDLTVEKINALFWYACHHNSDNGGIKSFSDFYYYLHEYFELITGSHFESVNDEKEFVSNSTWYSLDAYENGESYYISFDHDPKVGYAVYQKTAMRVLAPSRNMTTPMVDLAVGCSRKSDKLVRIPVEEIKQNLNNLRQVDTPVMIIDDDARYRLFITARRHSYTLKELAQLLGFDHKYLLNINSHFNKTGGHVWQREYCQAFRNIHQKDLLDIFVDDTKDDEEITSILKYTPIQQFLGFCATIAVNHEK